MNAQSGDGGLLFSTELNGPFSSIINVMMVIITSNNSTSNSYDLLATALGLLHTFLYFSQQPFEVKSYARFIGENTES
jgi:hypothetical protein